MSALKFVPVLPGDTKGKRFSLSLKGPEVDQLQEALEIIDRCPAFVAPDGREFPHCYSERKFFAHAVKLVIRAILRSGKFHHHSEI